MIEDANDIPRLRTRAREPEPPLFGAHHLVITSEREFNREDSDRMLGIAEARHRLLFFFAVGPGGYVPRVNACLARCCQSSACVIWVVDVPFESLELRDERQEALAAGLESAPCILRELCSAFHVCGEVAEEGTPVRVCCD